MERRGVILGSPHRRIVQLLLNVPGNLSQSWTIRIVTGSRVSTAIEWCSAYIGKLSDGYPELVVGCVGVDAAQHKLSIKLVEGGGIGRIVGIGSGDALNGQKRHGDSDRCGQAEKNQQNSRGTPV